jgi:hypothetical protein
VRVHLAAEHAFEFELAYACLESAGVALNIARRGFIIFELGEFEQCARIADSGVGAVELLDLRTQARAFAAELLGAIVRAPNCRVLKLATDLFETFLLAIVLKETPSRRRRAPRDL